MFGERYFATRERLADVMRGIVALARDTGASIQDLLPLDELRRDLRSPYLFVVCGEVNSGKSTFLNGLFGADICRVNVLPETNRVMVYQHGQTPKDTLLTPVLEECYRPAPFLRDFTFVDTPGTNSSVQDHLEIATRFMPTADLILVVFPVSNPWGAATWNYVAQIPQDCLRKVVFVIQQADQKDPKDLQVIRGHLSDLAMKRIGFAPSIFPVSGKLANEAKRSNPFQPSLYHASGYADLEHYISLHVCESPARRAALETWRSQCAAALRNIEDHTEDQSRVLSSRGRFLEGVGEEIDGIRERFVIRLPLHLKEVAEVFQTEAEWVTKNLRSRLGVIPSLVRLFIGDRTGAAMETIFAKRLEAAVQAVAEKDGIEVVESCRRHWDELAPRVKEAMDTDLTSAKPLDDTLTTANKRFVQRLADAAREGISSLKVRNQLDKNLRTRNRAMKSFTFMTLLFIIGGATCGALDIPWAPVIFLALAGLFFCGGVIIAFITRRAITADFRSRLLDTCDAFASTLRTDYEEALRVVFQDYATSLSMVNTQLAKEKLAMQPRLKRWQDLFLTLKAIEQDL